MLTIILISWLIIGYISFLLTIKVISYDVCIGHMLFGILASIFGPIWTLVLLYFLLCNATWIDKKVF